MAAPITGPVAAGPGGVQIVFRPPLEFIERQTGAFRLALDDMTGLFARIEPIMQDVEEEQFDTRGRGGWPDLAESTLAEKERLGYPADPLVRTGDLRASLVDPARAARVSARELAWETTVPYAHWHQTGGTTPGRPPMRQVIPDPFPPDKRMELEAAMVTWINERATVAFRGFA